MDAGGRLSADGCLRNPATRDPNVYGTQRAAPSLERHHRAVCVGCMPHGWLASTRASTMGAQRALPRQARTERRASWVRSMHRVVPRGSVRVRPSGGLLAARCRLERSQRVLDVRSAKFRTSVAQNGDIGSPSLTVFQFIPRLNCVISSGDQKCMLTTCVVRPKSFSVAENKNLALAGANATQPPRLTAANSVS